jgi:two-component system, OmpR family, sensor kinase
MSEGADNQVSGRAAQPWRAVRGLNDRTSLRTKLITALLVLVALAVAAMSISSALVLRSYLVSQDDPQLQAAYDTIVSNSLMNGAQPGQPYLWHGYLVAIQQPGVPISASGTQPGLPGPGGNAQPQSVPSVPTSVLWADTHNGKPVTVQAQSGNNTWRVIAGPITYQVVAGTGVTQQVTGTLIVGINLGNINATIGRLAAADLVIGAIIVLVLALAITAVVRANLRTLVEIEETAGEIADGYLDRRVPERDPRTEIGRLGRSLNVMLSQIETAFHAQEESEAAARHAEDRMRRFIADASHELRTPLTAIRGFAEYYRQRGGMIRRRDKEEADGGAGTQDDVVTTATGLTPGDVDRLMGRVEKEAARMGLLVEDLLLLARLDHRRPLARQPVDLLSLAGDAVHDARVLAPGRTIELSVAPGAAFLVIGDEARLRQVIGNLMSNALTHTPEGTPIEVSISSGVLDPRKSDPTPAVLLDVTDHGPGMSAEQAQRVFERFYRTDRARTRATGGSGLGLAIVNALVTAQGGVASVRTTEGKGSTFRIALPLAPEAQDGQDPDDDPGQRAATEEPDVISDTDTVSRGA